MKGDSNLKVLKKRDIDLFLGEHRRDLKLNWEQAKKKYPEMKGHHDSDFDGTLNADDCRPLNPAKDTKKIMLNKLNERRLNKW